MWREKEKWGKFITTKTEELGMWFSVRHLVPSR